MTATTPTLPVLRTSASTGRLWKTGLTAGAAAGVATVATAAVAHGAGVSLDISGEAIPLPGFAQLTVVGAVIGTILAVVFSHRASNPYRTFVRTTLALTALSIVPDVLVDAAVATKLTLALTHVVAAAIVVPALASRLSR
jgi:hypothetical protein